MFDFSVATGADLTAGEASNANSNPERSRALAESSELCSVEMLPLEAEYRVAQ